MRKIYLMGFLIAVLFARVESSNLEYTIYLESWDADYESAYKGVVTSPDSQFQNYNGVTVNISFAAFTFTAASGYPTNASGLYGTAFGGSYGGQDSLVGDVIDYVHTHGGNVQLAYGGNSYAAPYAPDYFISQTTADGGWPNNISSLATGVANVINNLSLDGVDFDIEDPLPSGFTPQQFAEDLTTFLRQVRALLPGKTITLTIPAQGWGQYWEYLAKNVAAVDGLVDAINFMEYDIWVNLTLPHGYVEQVEADIVTYTSSKDSAPAPNWAQGWGIPPHLIQLGIMPGYDDTKQLMTTEGSQSLTRFGIEKGLKGVFIWDIDRDALTNETPVPFYPSTPYAYSNAIRFIIGELEDTVTTTKFAGRSAYRRFVNYENLFIKQINPRMGIAPYYN